MKRLEGEVLDQMQAFGAGQQRLEAEGLTVDPHQFLGLELNPRAAAIAELVLWIGYLQWHFRTNGSGLPPQPILKDFKNVECRDAVLAWDSVETVLDERGVPVSRWDGVTTKTHPVTGEAVPDENARTHAAALHQPAQGSEWPAGRLHRRQPALHRRRQHARRARRRLRRSAAQHVAGRSRIGRPRHVLVAPRRATRRARRSAALRPDHHQQPEADFQPPRRAGRARQGRIAGLCRSRPSVGR